jgi:hypothetical protein
MAVCCQNLTLGALSSRSALSMAIGALFKKFGFFFNNPRVSSRIYFCCVFVLSKCFVVILHVGAKTCRNTLPSRTHPVKSQTGNACVQDLSHNSRVGIGCRKIGMEVWRLPMCNL